MIFQNKIVKNLTIFTLMLTFLIMTILFFTTSLMKENLTLMILISLSLLVAFVIISVTKDSVDKNSNLPNLFQMKYWKGALKEHVDLRKLIFASLMLSIMIISRNFALPTGFGPLQLRWSFIPWSIAAVVVGPIWSMVLAVLYDILGFFLFTPGGTFLFSMTALSILRGLIFGLFLYKTKITFSKIFTMFFIINLIINAIFQGMVLSLQWLGHETLAQTRVHIISSSLPNNLVSFIPRVLLVFLILKSLLPILKLNNLIDEEIDEEITLF